MTTDEKTMGKRIVVGAGIAAAFVLVAGLYSCSGGDDAPEAPKAAAPVATAPAPARSQETVNDYVAAPAQQAAPVAAEPTAAPKKGDDEATKDLKRTLLRTADLNYLNNRGYKVDLSSAKIGRSCLADNSVEPGWKGTSSSISYNVSRGGQSGTICVSHSGSQGSNISASNFIPN